MQKKIDCHIRMVIVETHLEVGAVIEGVATSAAAEVAEGEAVEAFGEIATATEKGAIDIPLAASEEVEEAEVVTLGNRSMAMTEEDVAVETLETTGEVAGAVVLGSRLATAVGEGVVSVTEGSIRETVSDHSLRKIRRLSSTIRYMMLI